MSELTEVDARGCRDGDVPARTGGSRVRGAAAALLVFVAAGLLLLHGALFGGQVLWAGADLVRHGPYPAELREQAPEGVPSLSDTVQCFAPWLRFAASHWRADGSLPLWKDTAGAGAPLLGNGQSALFFPTNLLAIVLGAPPMALALQALAKLVAAAFGAWLLARHLGASFAASLLCGLVFGFGGFQVAWVGFPLSSVSLLLPLLIVAGDRLVRAPSAGGLALLAGIAALQHLGGHPETAFHCQITLLLLGCARVASLRASIGWRAALQRIGWLVAGLGVGLVLAAFQLLPLLEYVTRSDLFVWRGRDVPAPPIHGLAVAGFVAGLLTALLALHRLAARERFRIRDATLLAAGTFLGVFAGLQAGLRASFMLLLAPDWLGSARHEFGPRFYVEEVGAFAGAALALAMAGVLAGRPRGIVRAACVVAALGALAGFGAPLLGDVLDRLPLFGVALNDRLLLLALLGTAVLAAVGLDALPRLRGADLRLRLLIMTLAPPLAAWAALACGVRLGLVTSDNAPPRVEGVALVEAHLVANDLVTPLLAGRAPAATQDATPDAAPDAAQAPKVCSGYVTLPEPAADIAVLYGRAGQRAPTVFAIAPGTQGASARLYVFRAEIPRAGQPLEASQVRVQARLRSGVLAASGKLTSVDDDPGRALAFPARPAPGTTTPLVLLLSLAALAWLLLAPSRGAWLAAGRWILPLITAASLSGFACNLLPQVPAGLFYPPSRTVDVLAGAWPDGRSVNLAPNLLPAEVPTFYAVHDARGYDALQPASVARLFDAALGRPGAPDFALLGLMSVRLLMNAPPAPGPPQGPHRDLTPQPPDRNGAVAFTIVENPWFLPRARLVGGAVIEPDDEQALARMRSPSFPRATVVILERGVAREPPAGDAGSARITDSAPDRVRVEVAPAAPAWLVLADTDFPGWAAFVDGRPRDIVRANVAFRAVAVEPGERVVEFRYEPGSFRLGLLLSALAALGLLGSVLLSRRRASGRIARAARSAGGH